MDQKLVTRAYNSFEFDLHTNRITKKSSNSKLQLEYEYFQQIEKDCGHLSALFPKVIDYWTEDGCKTYHLMMEYYAYPNLGMAMIDDTQSSFISLDFWKSVAHKLYKLITEDFNGCEEGKTPYTNRYSRDMYVNKTEREYNALKTNFEFFSNLCSEKELIINGKKCLNFEVIWNDIKEYIEKSLCRDIPFYVIHGDMCFSNILCGMSYNNEPIFKFIDPRGSFGSLGGVYGDPLYDVAKLFHSFEGMYEFIINDKFSLTEITPLKEYLYSFDCDLLAKHFLQGIFEKQFNDFDLTRVRLIEGLIFVGMCARHYDSLDRQKVMYMTGLSILNDIYKEIK